MARQRPQQPPEPHADLSALLTAQAQQEVVNSLLRLNPTATQALAGDPVRQAQENVQTLRAAVQMMEARNRAAGSPAGQRELREEIRLTRQLSQERQRFNEQFRRAAPPPPLRERFGGAVAGAREGFSAAGGAATAATAGAFNLVGQFNPYLTERFNRTVADLMAVVGRDLAPVVESATVRVRALADAYLALDPKTHQFITTLGETALAVAGATLALKGLGVVGGFIGRNPKVAGVAAAVGVAEMIGAAGEKQLGEAQERRERSQRLESGQARAGDLAEYRPFIETLARRPAGEREQILAGRERLIQANVERLRKEAGELGVSDPFKGVGGALKAVDVGLDQVVKFFGREVGLPFANRTPLQVAEELSRAENQLRNARQLRRDLEGAGVIAGPQAGQPDRLPAFNPAHGALQAGFGVGPLAAAVPPAGQPPQAGGRSGWGMIADIMVGRPGPNAGASIGAAYNPNAGVVSDVTAAYRDLLSASLRGSALPGRDAKEPAEQTVDVLTEIRRILERIERGGGNPAPPPDGQPLRLR
jgi:hypothetical protein